jgi:aryl-alcohol dehydrogenase-like predicted oxidoreductase
VGGWEAFSGRAGPMINPCARCDWPSNSESNFIDTALAYGDGQSEKSVGRAVRESDLPIVIATKIPPADRVWPARTGARFDDIFIRQYVMDCTDTSSRNLGVDRVDLQQFHVWNSRWTQGEEWRRLFEDLKRSGKVLYPGVSVTEHDPDSGIELVKSGLVDSLQVIYNIFDPWAADQLFPCRREKRCRYSCARAFGRRRFYRVHSGRQRV